MLKGREEEFVGVSLGYKSDINDGVRPKEVTMLLQEEMGSCYAERKEINSSLD